MYFLYVSHEDSDNWEEDVLGDSILWDGESVRVDLSNYPSSIFDVRAEDEDGDTYTIYGIDVATEDLNLTLAHMDLEADQTGDFDGYIEVTNKTGYDIYYLYVSHENSTSWEEDVLGESILPNGDSVRVDLTGYASSVFDVQAKDEDGDTYTIMGIDVAKQDLTIRLEHLDN